MGNHAQLIREIPVKRLKRPLALKRDTIRVLSVELTTVQAGQHTVPTRLCDTVGATCSLNQQQ